MPIAVTAAKSQNYGRHANSRVHRGASSITASLHLAEFNANLLRDAFLCVETLDYPNAVFRKANLVAAISFKIRPDQL